MGGIVEVVKSTFEKLRRAPGKAVVLKIQGAFEQERKMELYHPPGVSSAPTEEDRVIEIPIGGVRVAIATHNYRIEVEPSTGETIIYSTDSSGDTVKSILKLDNDGNIDLNGDDKRLVTFAELDAALQSFQSSVDAAIASAITGHTHGGIAVGTATSSPGAGSASPSSVDISAAETTTIRTGG